MKWLSSLGGALMLSLLAAAAVHFGFRGAFVSDGVGFVTTAYSAALTAALVGRSALRAQLVDRIWLRVPVAVASSVFVLWLLRGALLLKLPVGEFTTTGHSPLFAIPVASVVGVALLEGLRAMRPRGRNTATTAASRES